MRWHCCWAFVLLVSIVVLSPMPPRASAQTEPAITTMRLASAAERVGEAVSEPPSEAWPRRNGELAPEPLTTDSGTRVRKAAPAKTLSAGQRGVQQASYVESQAGKPLVDAANFNRSRSIAGVYPSAAAQATLNKLPRRAPVQSTAPAPSPAAQTTRPQGKPFQVIQADPALSPYLNLYRTNLNPNMMPNYFALVRPQFEQQAMNRKQAAEIQNLQRQVQSGQRAGGSSAGSLPRSGMSARARYMDTGQFYQPMGH